MATQDKPYRVYRGGRTKGKVPTLPPPERSRRSDGRRPTARPPVAPEQPERTRRTSTGRRIGIALIVLLLLVVAWAVASFLAVRSGVRDANARLDDDARAALAPDEGSLVSNPSVILLLGTDHWAAVTDRQGARRADSILLVRTDPRRGRLTYLSIPRDLQVEVPGIGTQKINAAAQFGGPALAIRTVRAFTGIRVNHVAVVDFADFEELVDALGGITVDVPKPILANKFDCPYATQERCDRWPGWRFAKGEQHMDGRRALVYSRIRVNRLDPSESDVTRGERQQAVTQAIMRKTLSPVTMAKMPMIGDELTAPLATDLSTWQFTQLAWSKFRADDGRSLHCRLGGEDAGGTLIPTEENRNVVSMFLGVSAAQPPAPGSPFAPGCRVGG
ncbi:MAG TPA: LCP family protein [Gaiellaceae bacterium]|nr:LCP family protein [Gaiellaceae bacterium]